MKVTAELTNPDALPKDVAFKVIPVTKQSVDYNYDAYMKALNDDADEAVEYTEENTLLYDMAFFAKNEAGKIVEVQPEKGTVKVNFEFKKQQLTEGIGAEKAADVEVVHLPLKEEVEADTTAEATGISASDVLVKKVADADLNASGNDTIQIKTKDFSLFAFSSALVASSIDEQNESVTTYTYKDNDVEVTATLEVAEAIPDNAELVVTRITPETDGFDYGAYVEALNSDNTAIKAESSSSAAMVIDEKSESGLSISFDAENDSSASADEEVLLYDIAFMVADDKSELKRREIQPQKGSVGIDFKFSNEMMEKESAWYGMTTGGKDKMLKVVKFGGSSLASSGQFHKVKDIIEYFISDKVICFPYLL